jgi:EPS-associated MarR family transcriptional regulator
MVGGRRSAVGGRRSAEGGIAARMNGMLSDEMHYKLMRLLQANPEMSQRRVAGELGISVGKVNFCVQALVQKGLVKARRFKNSRNKAAYMYLLTPRGIEQKAAFTLRFLRMRLREYELLGAEIEEIRRDAERSGYTVEGEGRVPPPRLRGSSLG